MPVRILLLVALFIGGYYAIRQWRSSVWLTRLPKLLVTTGVIGALLWLTVRGGGEIALPVLAVLIPVLLRWWQVAPFFTGTPNTTARSSINTRFLQMTLEHASGVMSGKVLEGRFAGCDLQSLTLQQLLELWRICQVDPQSVAVLEAYLDRQGDSAWREHLKEGERFEETADASMKRLNRMGRKEAYEILGLSVGASPEDIQTAYRRLIQRLHPDQGGSAYLAACLNQAREILLSEKRD